MKPLSRFWVFYGNLRLKFQPRMVASMTDGPNPQVRVQTVSWPVWKAKRAWRTLVSPLNRWWQSLPPSKKARLALIPLIRGNTPNGILVSRVTAVYGWYFAEQLFRGHVTWEAQVNTLERLARETGLDPIATIEEEYRRSINTMAQQIQAGLEPGPYSGKIVLP